MTAQQCDDSLFEGLTKCLAAAPEDISEMAAG
jgi:hypothetical protein